MKAVQDYYQASEQFPAKAILLIKKPIHPIAFTRRTPNPAIQGFCIDDP